LEVETYLSLRKVDGLNSAVLDSLSCCQGFYLQVLFWGQVLTVALQVEVQLQIWGKILNVWEYLPSSNFSMAKPFWSTTSICHYMCYTKVTNQHHMFYIQQIHASA